LRSAMETLRFEFPWTDPSGRTILYRGSGLGTDRHLSPPGVFVLSFPARFSGSMTSLLHRTLGRHHRALRCLPRNHAWPFASCVLGKFKPPVGLGTSGNPIAHLFCRARASFGSSPQRDVGVSSPELSEERSPIKRRFTNGVADGALGDIDSNDGKRGRRQDIHKAWESLGWGWRELTPETIRFCLPIRQARDNRRSSAIARGRCLTGNTPDGAPGHYYAVRLGFTVSMPGPRKWPAWEARNPV